MIPKHPRDPFLQIVEGQGKLAGRFTNIQRLGTGGGNGTFSLVFTAFDELTQTVVALKVFHPRYYPDSYRWQCFQREPQVLRQFFGMPDILQWVSSLESFSVSLGSWGLEEQFSFFATELATGDAEYAVMSGQWTWAEKLDRFRAMCRAIQRIHAAGVVHRDVKLANFLTLESRTMLCDFGTARSLFGMDHPILPQYALPVGDTTYASPELFAGIQDLEPAIYFKSDLYALGATLPPRDILICFYG